MPIFTSSTQTIPKALEEIVNRAKEIGVDDGAWSLAELCLDEADFDWLCEWARNLDANTAKQWLCPSLAKDAVTEKNELTYRSAIGTLLLLFAAEYARRSLPCYGDWLVPADSVYQADTAALLFSAAQPSPIYQSALRLAIKRLGLRSMPGWEDREQFNRTLTLQYGFTTAAIDYGLAKWMKEQEPTQEVSLLLDKKLGSKSFWRIWHTLRLYQQGKFTIAWIKEDLKTSPWILTSWIEPILTEPPIPKDLPDAPKPLLTSPPSTVIVSPLPSQYTPPATVLVDAVAGTIEESVSKDLFAAFTPFGGLKTIVKAVRAILNHAQEKGIQHPWSLAELCPTDYDYAWLRVVVKRLEPVAVDYCQKGGINIRLHKGEEVSAKNPALSLQAGLGLLLLLWMTETARRQAVEGELWPVILPDSFQPMTAAMLFKGNLPTTLFRQLLQSAAREVGLRHAFDDANAQYYLNTAYLQFGITHRGLQNRLPEWLSGAGTTLSIQALLAPVTGSESFQELWESLRDFRQENLTEAQVRERIDGNPWVLPEWTDELLEQAQKKIVLAGIAAGDAEAEPTFLTPPVLCWKPADMPYFRCHFRLDFLEKTPLNEDAYDLQIGGRRIGQLLRQPDGYYLPTFGLTINLPLQTARVSASLRGPDGIAVAAQELELWPEEEDITIFKMPSGERLPDAYHTALKTTSEYALLLAPDLIVDPPSTDYFQQTNLQLCRLAKGWMSNAKVLLEGEVFWEPLLSLKVPKPLPGWTKEVYPFDLKDVVRLGQSLHIKITHPAEVKISYVRCDGRAIAFKNGTASPVQAGPILLGPTQTSAALKLQIGAKNGGERQRISQSLKLELIGAAHLTNLGWQVLSGGQGLTLEEAANDAFRILPPKSWKDEATKLTDWFLLEGERPVRCLKSGQPPLGRLAGRGDAVTLRYGPYNSDQVALWIAQSIYHPGLVREVECDEIPGGGASLLRIRLRQSLEPGPDHAVIWWDATGEIVKLTPDSFGEVDGDMWWMCELPSNLTDYFAVAVSWHGTRLGATWKKETEWCDFLPEIASTNPQQTANLLRWFHLPILHQTAFPVMQSLWEAYAVEFLSAWICSKGLPEELHEEIVADDWYVALRKLLRQWQPSPEMAEAILMQLSCAANGEELNQALPALVGMLTEVDPVLCGKFLKAWKILSPETSFDAIRWQMAGCSHQAEYWTAKNNLLTKAQAATGLPNTFIEKGIMNYATQLVKGKKIESLHELNIALGSQVDVIRKLISLKILETI